MFRGILDALSNSVIIPGQNSVNEFNSPVSFEIRQSNITHRHSNLICAGGCSYKLSCFCEHQRLCVQEEKHCDHNEQQLESAPNCRRQHSLVVPATLAYLWEAVCRTFRLRVAITSCYAPWERTSLDSLRV